MQTTPKRIKEIAKMLYADESGPQWGLLSEAQVAPSEQTYTILFAAILAQGALLHQNDLAKSR